MDRSRREVPPRLARAASQFAAWRQGRVLGERIPASLWKVAADLAATYGVCQTASILKVGYYGLKERDDARESATNRASDSNSASTSAFLEWFPPTVAAPVECVIEVENASGAKMRVQLKGGHLPDLVALSAGFWNMPR